MSKHFGDNGEEKLLKGRNLQNNHTQAIYHDWFGWGEEDRTKTCFGSEPEINDD